jgi:hypothetical protein
MLLIFCISVARDEVPRDAFQGLGLPWTSILRALSNEYIKIGNDMKT